MSSFFKWFGIVTLVVIGGFVLNVLGIFTHAANNAVDTVHGVTDRVINADHALETYRWFHESYQQIQAKKGQIKLNKAALEAAKEDRQEARRVELLGVQQGCQSLVSEYNAKATRADTVIFQHPEKFLPGNWPGDRKPLPQSIDLAECE